MNIKITQEKFLESEAKIVQSEIAKSPDITGYSLRELLGFESVFKAYSDGEFAGACINFDFGERWTELSGFVVLPKFRGQGIGRALYQTAWEDAVNRKRNIYVVSRHPAMQKIMCRSDLKIIAEFRKLPRAIRLHSLRFAISWYRLLEAIRKWPMKKSGKFIFGIKQITNNPTS